MNKIVGYLKETRAEISKVVWPGREYVIQATMIVIAVSLLIGFVVMLLDLGFAKAILALKQVF